MKIQNDSDALKAIKALDDYLRGKIQGLYWTHHMLEELRHHYIATTGIHTRGLRGLALELRQNEIDISEQIHVENTAPAKKENSHAAEDRAGS